MSNPEKKKTGDKYQLSPVHHTFDVKLATVLGSIELAILVYHFTFWIDLNARAKRNFHDGKCWTYQTLEEISHYFPYWSRDQVKRYIQKLVKNNVLVKKNYNKNSFDKTPWYSFSDEFAPSMVQNCPIGSANMHHPLCETAPCIYTDNKTDNKTDKRGGKPPSANADSPTRSDFSSKEKEIERAKHVATTEEDHQKLVELYGAEMTAEAYEVLSLWKLDTPKSKWKKSDYRSIRRWTIDAVKEKRKKEGTPEKQQEKQAEIVENNQKWAKEKLKNISFNSNASIQIGDTCVMFKSDLGYIPVGYAEPNFREIIERQLKIIQGLQ